MTPKPVLVVGAGPTGLFLALWLARLGAPVRVIDKDEGPGETSRAMGVHARTLEFYRQLGFADEVVGKGLKVETISVRKAGVLEGSLTFGDFGKGLSPYPFMLSFPQDEHEKVLLAHLEATGVHVERRTEMTDYEQDGDSATATLCGPSGTETMQASYIAGCDGARSTVRKEADIGLPGGTYHQRFFVADAEVEGEAAQDSMSICLTGQDFCMVIPLRRPGSARLIGIVPDEVDGDHVRFDDVAAAVKRNTALVVKHVAWFSTYHVHHRVSDTFRDRRAFLLGDAAHLHSPVGGQGMNTGLGDAANLGWKLAAVLAGRASPELLDSYEPERIAFARKLVSSTDRMFTLVTNRGLVGKGWRTLVLARLAPLAFKVAAVPRMAFRTASQIEIQYHDSPLSQGKAGGVQAGDRLPWVQAPDGSDNFAPLRTLDWQVHVYGTSEPALREAAAAHGLALHTFPWSDAADAKGLAPDALYLVRPDGYVGLADAGADPAVLAAYAARWEIATEPAAG